MWYGDLVTMAWWDDLWLNEAFATWMAYQVVDDWKPEWRMWHDFEHHRAAALGLDALAQHAPDLRARCGRRSEATENFDSHHLREGRVGGAHDRALPRRRGLPRRRARSTSARTARATRSRPICGARWPRRRAATSSRSCAPGSSSRASRSLRAAPHRARRAQLAALRAGALPGRTARAARADGARWPVPWVGRVGRAARARAPCASSSTKRRGEIDAAGRGPRFVYGNADEGGFYRPLHDDGRARRARGRARTRSRRRAHGPRRPPVGRGARGPRRRRELPRPRPRARRRSATPTCSWRCAAPLGCASTLGRPRARRRGRGRAARPRSRAPSAAPSRALGWERRPRESDDDAAPPRRAARASSASVAEAPARARRGAARAATRYLADRRSLEPNLADPVVSLAARGGDAALFERFLAASREARDAAGAAPLPAGARRLPRRRALVERALALTLTDAVGTQDVAFLLVRLARQPRGARARPGPSGRSASTKLRRRMPPMLVTRPIEALPALGTRAYRREVAAFFRANPVPTGGARREAGARALRPEPRLRRACRARARGLDPSPPESSPLSLGGLAGGPDFALLSPHAPARLPLESAEPLRVAALRRRAPRRRAADAEREPARRSSSPIPRARSSPPTRVPTSASTRA